MLSLQKPDSVLINLQGPFGIKVGSALVTRTEFMFYNSIENKLITGLSSIENLNRILHMQLSFDDLLSLFGGGTFLEKDFHAPDEIQVEDHQYVFAFQIGEIDTEVLDRSGDSVHSENPFSRSAREAGAGTNVQQFRRCERI